MLLHIANLRYQRGQGEQGFSVLLPRLTLARGELLALTGESGSNADDRSESATPTMRSTSFVSIVV